MFAVSRKLVDIEGTGTKILTSREHADLYSEVEFIAEGGSPSSQMSSYVIGSEYGAFPSSTKEGYSISAWCSDSACTQVVDSDSEVDYRIQKMYAGWKERGSYTRLEYIESTATSISEGQYISLPDVKLQSSDKITFEFMPLDLSHNFALWCSRQDYTLNTNTVFWINGSSVRFDYNTVNSYTGFSITANTKYTLSTDANKLYNGSTLIYTNTASTFSNSYGTTLFASNVANSSLTNFGKYRLYRFKVDGKCDLIPVKDPDGVVCMYDTVSETYFYNQRTGSFVAGPEIVEVEYLESSGTQYIDTGIYPTEAMKVECTCEHSGSKSCSFSCRWTGASTYDTYGCYVNSSQLTYYFGRFSDSKYINIASIDYLSKHTETIENGTLTISYPSSSTTYQYSISDSTFTSTYPLYLFMMNNCGTSTAGATTKIYDFAMYSGSTAIIDLIPVKVDNVGYMYDKVSHKLFGNSGTGSFTIGPEV